MIGRMGTTTTLRYLILGLLMLPLPGIAEPGTSVGEVIPKGELDGIPMHIIHVPTYKHGEAGITLDGVPNEPIWRTLPYYDNLIGSVPATGLPGDYPSEFRVFATEKGLYISAVLYQPPETINNRHTKRDAQGERDTIGITIDATGVGAFAYWFVLSASGSIQDGKVLPVRRYSSVWDGTWVHKTALRNDGWSAETFFPWSMMTLPETPGDYREIGFAFSRQVSHKNQRTYWPGHPYSSRQFVTALNTMQLEGIEPRQLIQVIPYASAIKDSARDDNELRVGVDVTWKPSTRAEVTLSANPDFGAVEADNVVLNLSALETYFPEKRLFFLEGNEIFETSPRTDSGKSMREAWNEDFSTASRLVYVTDFLAPPLALINTRRIGGLSTQAVVPGGVTLERGEADLPTNLLGAIKLKGQLGTTQYGVLSAFEDDVEWRGRNVAGDQITVENAGRDFGALRVSHEFNGHNFNAAGYLGTYVTGPLYDATVHGLDWHYATRDRSFSSDVQLIASDVAGVGGQAALAEFSVASSRTYQHRLQLEYFDEEVNINDLGFLARNDQMGAQYLFNYAHRPGADLLKKYRGSLAVRQMFNVSKHQVVESSVAWRNITELAGRNTFRTVAAWMPARYEDIDSRGNGAYRAGDRLWLDVQWSSSANRPVSWTLSAGGWNEDRGDWTQQYSAGVTLQAADNLSIDVDVKYRRRDGWLVYQGANNFGAYNGIEWQPKAEVNWFISAEHQLRFSMQWAGVRMDERGFFAVPVGDGELVPATRTRDYDFTVSLLTAQLRYRWEIAPLTDLYVVYNRGNRLPYRARDSFDDLFSDSFTDPLVDSLVVKFRYRFAN